MVHPAAQGSGRLRGRIAATRRWHGEAPEELHHALGVALAAEHLAVTLEDLDLTSSDVEFLHRRLDELAAA